MAQSLSFKDSNILSTDVQQEHDNINAIFSNTA